MLNGLIKPGLKRNGISIKSLLIEGEIFNDDFEICNILNNHFSTIGKKICDSFEDTEHHITTLTNVSNSLFFKNTTSDEISKIINKMKNKSCNINAIPVKVLKHVHFILSSILSHIINKSLNNGYFPNCFKTARVIPLHKGDSRDDVNNYRPISILSTFSKIFERVVYNQLYSFLDKYNLFNPNQFGFRKSKSTVQAVLDQLSFVYNNLDQSNTVISIFMDFSKAFDCLDHRLLLKKLYHFGIRGIPFQWFQSYLSNRNQYVSVNNNRSSTQPISHGVPQGSCLGPLLFLLFINDFPDVNPFFKYSLFADDSTLTCKFNNMSEASIKQKLEHELESIYNWLKMNKIKINYEKSKFIMFSYGKEYSICNLKFGNGLISVTDSTKFLGIMIDKNLKFRSHISYISNKISKIVGLLFRLNNILPVETLKTLYVTLLEPHLLYGIEVWYGALQSNDDRIFKLQKKSIRAINSLPYNSHTNDYFKLMEILKLEDLSKWRSLTYIFKNENLSTTADIHSYNTRNRDNLSIPRFNRSRTQSTIFYQGILLWNALPNDIRTLQYVGAFNNATKKLLLSSY